MPSFTRPGSSVIDYNAVTGDSVTTAAQKQDIALNDLYTNIVDGTAAVKGIVQLGTTATTAALGNHLHAGVYAASGANSDITSLSGLTTPLSVAQGGTASATAAGARAALDLEIGADVQAYDADTMKSDVVTARTRAHRFTPVQVTAASGGALSIDCDLHEECYITLSETTTTVGEATNQANGKYVVFVVTGTTGKALAWNTNWQKDGANCAIAAPANGVVDMHCFRSSGTEMIHIGSKLAV